MGDFKAAYDVVRKNEGGYANNSNDRGGETYKGIARKMWPSWDGWAIVDVHKALTNFPRSLEGDAELQTRVLSFFKINFWDQLMLDQVNSQIISTELFDTAVNMGLSTAATFLQRSLNASNRNGKDFSDLQIDGKIGSKTIATLNGHKNQYVVLKLLNVLQGERYISICEHNPSQEEFLYSWMSRVVI